MPVVAANFLYLGAQNPSASPVKEVAPPVRVGGVLCTSDKLQATDSSYELQDTSQLICKILELLQGTVFSDRPVFRSDIFNQEKGRKKNNDFLKENMTEMPRKKTFFEDKKFLKMFCSIFEKKKQQ